MGFWEMVVILGALGIVSDMYRARLKSRTKLREQGEYVEGLAERLNKIDRRLANLETIVIEREKRNAFEEAL